MTNLGSDAQRSSRDVSARRLRVTDTVSVNYGGRTFTATPRMAEAFFSRAQRIIEAGGAELVPFLHSGGVDMLFVSREIPFSGVNLRGVSTGVGVADVA